LPSIPQNHTPETLSSQPILDQLDKHNPLVPSCIQTIYL
jgi:hypothetical protein